MLPSVEIMEKLEIEKKNNTPSVIFDPELGLLKIEGRSIPENPGEFYEDLIAWVKEYFKKPCASTKIDLNLEYVNSGSSKYLLGFFKVIKAEAESVLEITGGAWWPADRVEVERNREMMLSALGADAFTRVQKTGEAMNMDQAITFANDVQP